MTDKSQIQITVDDRERNPVILKSLREAEHTNVKIERLKAGDYLLNDLIIERKTFPDFVKSIIDGRLFRQSISLAFLHNSCMIILEGTYKDAFKAKMKREAIQGALITLELIFRIPVLRSVSPQESARIMIYAANQIHRHEMGIWRNKRAVKTGIRKTDKYRNQTQILQGISSIGSVKANHLLKEFGSLKNIFNATPDQLTKTMGIGKIQAEQIYKIVNEKVM
jgi:ERCC4-type nuclease